MGVYIICIDICMYLYIYVYVYVYIIYIYTYTHTIRILMILCIINIYAWIPNDRAFIFKNVLNYSTVPVDPKISGHFKIPKPDGMVDASCFIKHHFSISDGA